MKTEIEVMFYKPRNANVCQQTTRSKERAWNRLALTTPQKNQPCPHHNLALLASRTGREQIPVVLSWYFVTAALKNEYT